MTRKYIDAPEFVRQATAHFEVLLDLDFVGPEVKGYMLLYSSSSLGVRVHYNDRDGYVRTVVTATVGERNPHASLDCLYAAAGLGPAQHVRSTARSRKLLGPVLETQVAALLQVLSVMAAADGVDLLLECHGR